MYLKKPVKDYLRLIATESLYPGSGSSMAYSGALAASLLIMSFRMLHDELNNKEKLQLNKFFSETDQIMEELERKIELDPALCKEFTKPKETALKEAALIPLLVAQKCNRLLELMLSIEKEIEIKNAALKAGVFPEVFAGMCSAYTGLMGSLECVGKNIQDLKEGELKDYLLAEVKRLTEAGEENFRNVKKYLKE